MVKSILRRLNKSSGQQFAFAGPRMRILVPPEYNEQVPDIQEAGGFFINSYRIEPALHFCQSLKNNSSFFFLTQFYDAELEMKNFNQVREFQKVFSTLIIKTFLTNI